MISKHCRCGHHQTVHRGPQTECRGVRKNGKNAVGVVQHVFCECESFRVTSLGFWERILWGTEEDPLAVSREGRSRL